MAKKESGVVKFFDRKKGFGFIQRDGADDLHFVWKSFAEDMTIGQFRGLRGTKVEYTTEPGKEGKTLVKDLRPVKK